MGVTHRIGCLYGFRTVCQVPVRPRSHSHCCKTKKCRLRSDIERKRLAGLDALARSCSGIGEALYSEKANFRTYTHLARLAGKLLCAGFSVIVDTAFLLRSEQGKTLRRLICMSCNTRSKPLRCCVQTSWTW